MENLDLKDLYWERLVGYYTELRIDARWILKSADTNEPYGQLRIVEHPDIRPGYLRAIFIYTTSIRKKNKEEIMKAIEDYQMNPTELEIYSVDNEIKTETETIERPYKELEAIFGVKIFI